MKVIKVIIAIEVVLLVGSLFFVGGAAAGLVLPRFSPSAGTALTDWLTSPLPPQWLASSDGAPAQQAAGGAGDTLFAPFWQAWQIVHDEFVDRPVNDEHLMQGAIRGMMDALGDPQSSYMDPQEYDQANIPLEGGYEGIGAWVDTDGEFLTIISAMPGSPAEAAGLLPGDEVVKVDGKDVTGVPPSLVIRQVMGPEGTQVVLSIRREGESDPFDVSITRKRIALPSVESRMLDQNLGYVRLSTFGGDTAGELRSTLKTLLAQNPDGLILDLRGNGGGYLKAAVDVASEFIPDGVVLTERFGDGKEESYYASGNGLALKIPLVVLVDGGSASASEIVAGAIQDSGRGWLVGQQSFGKGSVQNWHPLDQNEGAVRVTIARWYTPGGRSIQGNGLLPDFAIELTSEDAAAHRDPQLDKAVDVLVHPPALPGVTPTLPRATPTPVLATPTP
jgi:carboxyl-terminal processing protease